MIADHSITLTGLDFNKISLLLLLLLLGKLCKIKKKVDLFSYLNFYASIKTLNEKLKK